MCAFKKPIPHCPSDGIEMLDTLPRRISKCSVAAYLQRSYKKQAGCHLSHRKFSPASTFVWLFGTNYLFTCLRIHQSALHRLKLLLELFLFKCPLVCISSPAAPVCETLPWTPASCLTRALMFRPRSCLFFICVFPIKVVELGGSLYWRKCKQGFGLKHFFYRRKCLCIFMNAILGCGWEVHACVEVFSHFLLGQEKRNISSTDNWWTAKGCERNCGNYVVSFSHNPSGDPMFEKEKMNK